VASQDARIARLKQSPLFGALASDTLAFILENAASVHHGAGEFFVREGDEGASLFLLEAGEVEIFQHREGEEVVLRHLGPGDCFGEIAHLDFGPRSASVRATRDCDAIEIGGALMRRLAEHDLEQFALLNMNIARELSRRLRVQ